MEQYIEGLSLPVIAVVVFWIIKLVRYAVNSEKFDRFIPLIAMLIGAAFGVIMFYVAPGMIAAQNPVVALVIGGASGLSATGSHQIFKQLNSGENGTRDKSVDGGNIL